ncbi:30S ribosomal protein S4e, partial [Candidatus Pacearchaeota archaeon]|nr:30S ribosomal protein S4e [Candidatus Pacearchaeota archaeon]
MHITRHNTSKRWPIPRKGTKYLVVPSRGNNDSIPLLIIMREILGIVKTRKELKKILNEKKVKINGLAIKEDKT